LIIGDWNLGLIWDLEFVIWDFERCALCALHNMNWVATFPPKYIQLEKLWKEDKE